jgi:large repetitive protein
MFDGCRNKAPLDSVPNIRILILSAISVAIALIAPAAASAAGEPNISLDMGAPGTALLGTNQTVSLVAKNPAGEKRGYNLSFRDVLPKGVRYVPGSAKGPNGEALEVHVIANAPIAANEETTLLIENVSDLSQNSEYRLTYEVEPETEVVNSVYENHAFAYVSRRARFKPKFNANGEVIPGEESFKGSAEAEAETKLTAIEIEKEEKSPEGEILRGVHEHQVTYTLHLRNNELQKTTDLGVDDWLPAGLEFLGCGQVDHTKISPTTGTKEEYPGSGEIFPGNKPAAPNCVEPTEVETVEVDPDGPKGPLAFGVYTHVVWTGLGELAPGGEKVIQYRAAIPILENTTSWPQGEPTHKSLGQAANLDNNSGNETYDEEPLTNYSKVHGFYEGNPEVEVEDEDSLTRTAEDLAIQKTVDKDTIAEGQLSKWTFELETSEYRYVNDIQVEDTLPNGLCPIGEVNYEMPIELKEECEPIGELPTAKYSSVAENSNGSWKILWNDTSVPQLEHMAPSSTFVITFPTKTRTFYQKEFKDSKTEPVLTGDSWTNDVLTFGENFARCVPNSPTCKLGEPTIPTKNWTQGKKVEDVSSASQQAGGVSIDKTVRANEGTVPADCDGTYVQGTGAPLPSYAPGDKICWQLVVNFASELYAGSPAVTDFLPPNEKYLVGSAAPVEPPNNVESEPDFSEAEGGALEWTLGGSVASGSKVWEWRFATEMGTSLESKPEDVTGNLMKFVYSNHVGQTFPLRDRAEIEREEPELQLTKGVLSVGGKPAGGNGPDQNATGAHGGEKVKYRLDLKNVGNLVAENIELWDRLPAGIECSDLVAGSISDGGECKAGNIIEWTGLAVAAEATHPSVTYEVTLPSDVAPNQTYVNTAGVRQFQSPTNTGGHFTYYPTENIDPELEKEHAPNTQKIKDPATVSTEEVGLTKTRTTTVTQAGNSAETATIGERVNYTVEAKIPAGSRLFGRPELIDPLSSRLALIPGTVQGKVTVGGVTTVIPNKTTTAGFEATEEGNKALLLFPTTFSNPPGEGPAAVVLEFGATVKDIAENTRLAAAIPNSATLEWLDQNEVERSASAAVNTTVVEPLVSVEKTHAGSETVKPGEVRAWTVTARNSNAANVSTANNSTVTDTVPNGLTPWKEGAKVLDGGVVGPAAENGTWNEGTRTITWTIAELAPGASKALHYELRVNEPANAGSVFKNKATIKTTSLPTEGGGERTASSASHTGYEASREAKVQLNDAEMTKAVEAPNGTTIGSPLIYTLKLKLPPSIHFFDTTVEDQLPKGITYDKTTSITCAPGCETEVAAKGKALTPSVAGGAQLLGWYFGEIQDAAVERTVTITYTAHIAGEVEGQKIVDTNKLPNKAIGLYNGETKLTEPPTVPPAQSKFTNKTNEPKAEVEVKEPKLAIVKSETGATAAPKTQPGDSYTYTVKVTNNGDSPAYDVVVKDDNPQGALREVEAKGVEGENFLPAGWAKGDPLQWNIPGPIAPGGFVTLKYTAKLAPSSELHQGDKVENVADVPLYFGVPKAQREAEPTTPKEVEEGKARYREYKEDPKSTVTLETELPVLELEKTVGPESEGQIDAQIGKPLTWHLKVTNLSPKAGLFGVNLVDTLPKGFEYKANSTTGTTGVTIANPTITEVGEAEVLTWTNAVASLPGGASQTLSFEAIPTLELALTPGIYVNKAVASGKDASGAPSSAAGAYEDESSARAKLITPGLRISKTPDVSEGAPAEAIAGRTKTYTIEIENEGSAEATGVEVTDLMGAGNVYTAGSATAEPGGLTETGVESVGVGETRVKWSLAPIPAKGKVFVHVPVSIPASTPDGTKLVDNATVISAQEKTPVSNEGSLLVKRQANLTFEKKGPATAVAGELVEYELFVNNPGPSVAEDVVLRDPIPTGLKFVSADSPCVEAPGGGEVVCELGTLAVGQLNHALDISFEVLPSTTGSVTNKATVTTPTEDETGPQEPKAEKTTTIETEADVSILKTGPSAPVLLGSTFVYTLEVENHGPSDALAVAVEDELPAEVEALSVDTDTGSCEPAAATVECELGTLTPAQKATIHVTVKSIGIPAGGGPVLNTATATSTTPDPTTPNESTAETTILPAADLAVTKTAPATVPADGEVTYGIHVVDNGPSDATGVKVTDPLPAGTQFVAASEGCAEAGGTVTCNVGELKVGESRDYKVTVKAPLALAGQPLVNTATVKGEQADPESTNDQSTVTTTVGPAADLSITKTMGKAEAGKPLVYTLAITNHGPSASSAVTVKDTLPAGTSFKSAAPSQGSCGASGQAVQCQLGPLASGGSAQVSITVEVAATATGTLRNSAVVEGPEPDPDKSNNESSVEGPVTPAAPSGTPNLKVVKTADTSTPQVGAPFDYDVAISNSGTAEAKNVKVVDTLNGPVQVVSIEAGPGKCDAAGSKIECTIPSVGVGKTVHVTYTVVAESTGALSNTASAMAANGEKVPTNNHAVKSVRAKAPKANFTLTKKAAKKVVAGGKKVGFAITLRNGASELTNAKVCDRLPAALVFVKAAGAAFVNGEACWREHYVAPHKVMRMHLTARAVKGAVSRRAKNVARASAANAKGTRQASATVRIEPVFGGAPGGVTG